MFEEPLKSSDAYFSVLARPRESESVSRLGLAIAKKQLRRAVDRNRIKRLVRESFRQEVPNDCGMDFVVMARSLVRRCNNADLRIHLNNHFRRLLAKQQQSQA